MWGVKIGFEVSMYLKRALPCSLSTLFISSSIIPLSLHSLSFAFLRFFIFSFKACLCLAASSSRALFAFARSRACRLWSSSSSLNPRVGSDFPPARSVASSEDQLYQRHPSISHRHGFLKLPSSLPRTAARVSPLSSLLMLRCKR